jgi:hypothetical protein
MSRRLTSIFPPILLKSFQISTHNKNLGGLWPVSVPPNHKFVAYPSRQNPAVRIFVGHCNDGILYGEREGSSKI